MSSSRRTLRVLLALAGAAGLAWLAWSQRSAVAAVDWSAHPWAFLGAAALLAVGPLLQAVVWRRALRGVGAAAPAREVLRLWGRSFLLRYEPSGALGYVARVVGRERVGASTAQVLTASGYEQLAVVCAGALAALGAFVMAGVSPPFVAVAGAVVAVGACFAVRPRVLGDRVAAWLRGRGIETTGPLPGRELAALVGLSLAGWLPAALACVLVAGAVGAGEVGAPLLVGGFALGWLLGVLVPLAPGGLGLREAGFVLAVAPVLGVGEATALGVALRLVATGGELLAVGVLEAVAARCGTSCTHVVHQVPHLPATSAGRTVVVVPTYCEAEVLPAFVERFAATGCDLLVVDDASPDGTGALAEALRADGRPWLHVLHRGGKDGLGVAYRDGFAWCLARGYDRIGQMDADLSHPPEALGELVAAVDAGAELAIGSRYVPGGSTPGWSLGRRVVSRIGSAGSRRLLRLPYRDLSGGFKVWDAALLRRLDLEAMLSAGYAFQVEATLLAHLEGARIVEVPFAFTERLAGTSKMTPAISAEGVKVAFELRRRHVVV